MSTAEIHPRRPGFTVGQEETLWESHPALRSTLYFWGFSILGAAFLFHFWGKLMAAFYADGLFANMPGLAGMIYAEPELMVWWLRILPSALCLLPVFLYSLSLACTSYKLTNQRLLVRTGILMRTHDQVELFRVRDFLIDAPIHLALMGLGHVRVISRDESLPVVTLIAQLDATTLIDTIRMQVQRRKDEVGMREIETNVQ